MTAYLFVFGRTPDFSYHELKALFPSALKLSQSIAIVELNDKRFVPQDVIQRIGGTVKIARVLGTVDAVSPYEMANFLSTERKGNNITFGISAYDTHIANTLKILTEIKKILERRGFKSRFIVGNDHSQLSSVVVSKQNVFELIVVSNKGKYIIGQTVVVQDFQDWNRRDYDRPYASPHTGMLPPKVARMAVNLLGNIQGKKTMLDPFCGMGTVLAEALLCGYQTEGSDISSDVVKKAQANIEWLRSAYPQIALKNVKFNIGDATHISDSVQPQSMDAIVTEPFMGKNLNSEAIKYPNSRASQIEIKNIIRGLEKLYLGCLKDWFRVLKPGGKIVIALPEYALSSQKIFVKRVIDNCENLGYTKLLGPIEYSRPQAIVKREFFVFQKS